jgi:hypothetical protein
MTAACGSIPVTPGDTLDVRINLFSGSDGNKLPLQIAAGEVFVLKVGREVASSAGQGPSRLQVLANEETTSFIRQFSPLETVKFGGSQGCPVPLEWSFSRIPTKGVHRTYAAGPITVELRPNGGTQVSFDLIVTDTGAVAIDLGPVPDVASYTDAVAAELRAEMATHSADSNSVAAAYALLL